MDLTRAHTPEELVRGGMCDPLKIFIKDEPHKIRKLREGRTRIIMNMSLVDNMVSRALFALQNDTEINTWSTICSKPGMGLNDAGLKTLYSTVQRESQHLRLAEGDVSGWDWSVQDWELDADLEMRLALNSGYGTVWEKISRAHYECIKNKILVTSDGEMFSQCFPGILPSGWYNTSSTNSRLRVLSHHLAFNISVPVSQFTSGWCMAMGDDSIELDFPGAVEAYSALGKTMKMFNPISDLLFEFCSMQFNNSWQAVPVNADKQIMNFLQFEPSCLSEASERLWQFCYEMRHHPDLTTFLSLIKKVRWAEYDGKEGQLCAGFPDAFPPTRSPL